MAQSEARRPKSRSDQDPVRLEGNLEALPCAAVLIDLDAVVLDSNALAQRLFRLPGHAAIGQRLPALGVGARTTELGRAVEEVKRGGAHLTIPEITLGTPDQAVVIARVTVAPVSAGGRLVAVLVTAEERTDVSLHAERDLLAGEVEALTIRHEAAERELLTTTEEL